MDTEDKIMEENIKHTLYENKNNRLLTSKFGMRGGALRCVGAAGAKEDVKR